MDRHHDHEVHEGGVTTQHAGQARHGRHAGRDGHAGHDGHHDSAAEAHAGHGNAGHGDHAAQFRDRFWLSLVLAVPVVLFNHMFAELLGYMPPSFPGSTWISPVLGTVVYLYGGWPFLTGAVTEARSSRPWM